MTHGVTPSVGTVPTEPASGDHVAVDAVIVGGGPRAVAVVARIAARLGDRPSADRSSGQPRLRVAIVDPVEVGAGSTWRTDQSALLLNNTEFARTTAHADVSTVMTGPVVAGPDLLSWARAVADPAAATDTPAGVAPRPDWLAEELRGAAADAFPTRRMQGVYYREQLAAAAAGAGIDLVAVTGTVVAVRSDGATRVARLAAGAEADGRAVSSLCAPTVVLAQGMLQSVPDARTVAFSRAAERGLVYVAPGMPSERDWGRVPAGEPVLVAGLGANFFDVVALLTAGRGGRFVDDVTGSATDAAGWPCDDGGAGGPAAGARLRYLPAGDEPLLLAGSRRGLPYRGKGAVADGGARPGHALRIATADWFSGLAERTGLDLRVDVWPTVLRELHVAHLSSVSRHQPHLLRRELSETQVIQLLFAADDPLATVRAEYRDPAAAPDLSRVDRAPALTGEAWARWVDGWVADEHASIADPDSSPRAAVNHAMGTLRGKVAALVAAGAVEGGSVRQDFFGWFNAMGLTLASGPPPRRTAQLLALVRAGVVRLTGPDLRVELVDQAAGAHFEADSATGERLVTRAFIETRMSKGEVDTTDDPLLRGWLESGRARRHRIPTAAGTVETRHLDVTVPDFHPIALDGTVDDAVVVLGIPAETVQPGSAIGATPGVASPMLAGADVAAAQILRTAGTTADPGKPATS